MKPVLYISAAMIVILFGYMTFQVNYETRDTRKRVVQLQREIASEREAISVLKVEWAYLNRPERLRVLSETYFSELRLMPLHAEHFADRSGVLSAVLGAVTPVVLRGE